MASAPNDGKAGAGTPEAGERLQVTSSRTPEKASGGALEPAAVDKGEKVAEVDGTGRGARAEPVESGEKAEAPGQSGVKPASETNAPASAPWATTTRAASPSSRPTSRQSGRTRASATATMLNKDALKEKGGAGGGGGGEAAATGSERDGNAARPRSAAAGRRPRNVPPLGKPPTAPTGTKSAGGGVTQSGADSAARDSAATPAETTTEAAAAAAKQQQASPRGSASARTRHSSESSMQSYRPEQRLDPRYRFPLGPLAPPLPEFWGGSVEGEILLNNLGAPSPMSLLRGKFIGAYFCTNSEVCNSVTAKLATVDAVIRAKHHPDDPEFQVVVCPTHKDDKAFWRHHPALPIQWLCIPWADPRLRKLAQRLKVVKVPTLVILDPQGRVVCRDAQIWLNADPGAEEFPWGPKPLWSILDAATPLVRGDGVQISIREIQDNADVVSLYFGAKWSPSSRAFTSTLADMYTRISMDRSPGRRWRVIYVPHDRHIGEFEDHLGMMPWCSLAFGDVRRVAALNTRFAVLGVPTVVMLDCVTGRVIAHDVRPDIQADPKGLDFPWPLAPIIPLDEGAGSRLNDNICVILLLDGTTRKQGMRAYENFEKVARAEFARRTATLHNYGETTASLAKYRKAVGIARARAARKSAEVSSLLLAIEAQRQAAREAHDKIVAEADAEEAKARKRLVKDRKAIEAAEAARAAARKELEEKEAELQRRAHDAAEELRAMRASVDELVIDDPITRRLRIAESQAEDAPFPEAEQSGMLFLVGDEDTDLTRPVRGFLQLNDVPAPNLIILDSVKQKKYFWLPNRVAAKDSDDDTARTAASTARRSVAASDAGRAGGGGGGGAASDADGGQAERKAGDDGDAGGATEAKGDDDDGGDGKTASDAHSDARSEAEPTAAGEAEHKAPDIGTSTGVTSPEVSEGSESEEIEEDDEAATPKGGGVTPTEREIRHFLRAFRANKLKPWNLLK